MNINRTPEHSDPELYDELGTLIGESELPVLDQLELVDTLLGMSKKTDSDLASVALSAVSSIQHMSAIQGRLGGGDTIGSIPAAKPKRSSRLVERFLPPPPGPKRRGNNAQLDSNPNRNT